MRQESTTPASEKVKLDAQGAYSHLDAISSQNIELRRKILFAAMNAHAWASARIVHEHTAARDTLEARIQKLVEDEKDQGRSSHPVPKSTFGMHTHLYHRDLGYVDSLSWLLIIPVFPQDRMRARLSEMFEAINNTVASLAGLC